MPPTDVGVGISPRGLLSLGFGCHVQVFKDSYTFNTIYTFRTRQYYSRSIRTWRICPRRTLTSRTGACSRWASGATYRYLKIRTLFNTISTIHTFQTRQYYSRFTRTWRICLRRTWAWASRTGACSRWASGATCRYFKIHTHLIQFIRFRHASTTVGPFVPGEYASDGRGHLPQGPALAGLRVPRPDILYATIMLILRSIHTIHTTFTVSTIRTVFAQGLRWLSAVSFAHFFVSRAQWLEFAATFENYHRNRNEPSDKDCRQILG